jgi:hypothetical protein
VRTHWAIDFEQPAGCRYLVTECRDGTYAIARRRIWEDEGDYGWIKHMGEKEWVDLPDFAEALRIARRRWPDIDQGAWHDRRAAQPRRRALSG